MYIKIFYEKLIFILAKPEQENLDELKQELEIDFHKVIFFCSEAISMIHVVRLSAAREIIIFRPLLRQ